MNIYDSYIEAGQELSQKQREKFYCAVIEYLYYGIEPDVDGAAKALVTAIFPMLEESRRCFENGKKGGRPRKTQTGENEKPNPPKTENPNAEIPETQTAENEKPKPPFSEKPKGKGKGNYKERLSKESPKKAERFAKPTPEEVAAYAAERGHPSFDGGQFCDFYESKGWKVGSTPMRDWRAAVRTWLRRSGEEAGDAYAEYDF